MLRKLFGGIRIPEPGQRLDFCENFQVVEFTLEKLRFLRSGLGNLCLG